MPEMFLLRRISQCCEFHDREYNKKLTQKNDILWKVNSGLAQRRNCKLAKYKKYPLAGRLLNIEKSNKQLIKLTPLCR